MDLDAHQQLMDACCLWLYVRQQLKNELSAEYMLKMDDMWTNGPLGWELGVCVCVCGREMASTTFFWYAICKKWVHKEFDHLAAHF